MAVIKTLVLALASVANAVITSSSAVSSSSTSVWDQGVPTDAPIPGDYSGALRPQVHFSPPQNFMNDPNGCFRDADGLWHLYYQYNPTEAVAGNQHWGHATSKDLYNWENQKIAIFPENADEQIFSGSAVVDVNNTSGFFPNSTNGVVAIYTRNTVDEQTQEIAYSTDGGYTFTKYSGNPVLSVNSTQFRDPYVIRYDDSWVMVVSYASDYVIGFFTSPDLKTWTHASNFSSHGLLGVQYECPNLVRMPVAGSDEKMWLLAISINPGAPLGGSIQQYFPGSFNGTVFTPVDGAARIADFGKDNYAAQFFNGVAEDEDPVMIGWASNWQYAQVVPTGPLENWRSVNTLPRRVHLATNVTLTGTTTGLGLIDYPYDLSPILNRTLASTTNLGNDSILVDYSSVDSGAVHLHCAVSKLTGSSSDLGTLNFTFSSSVTRESVSGGFIFGTTMFWLSRQNIRGFGDENPFFTDKFSTTNNLNPERTFDLEVVIDRSILEVFLDKGRSSATTIFYPQGRLDTLEVRAGGLSEGVVVEVTAKALTGTW